MRDIIKDFKEAVSLYERARNIGKNIGLNKDLSSTNLPSELLERAKWVKEGINLCRKALLIVSIMSLTNSSDKIKLLKDKIEIESVNLRETFKNINEKLANINLFPQKENELNKEDLNTADENADIEEMRKEVLQTLKRLQFLATKINAKKLHQLKKNLKNIIS